MTDQPTNTLTDAERERLAICRCGHRIESHTWSGCTAYLVPRIGASGSCCSRTPEDLLADAYAAGIAARGGNTDNTHSSPYDEDGYCDHCGTGQWKPHAPDCGWADLQDARADAWDEGWKAARQVVELDGVKCWAHTVFPEGYEGNPYRNADAAPAPTDNQHNNGLADQMAIAQAIYDGGQERWLPTIDGSANSAAYEYARRALHAVADGPTTPTQEV